jgi:hypothetical protein
MARTVIRERQVLDSDFASEVEMEEKFNQHKADTLHPPAAVPGTDDGMYLKFDGTNYVWSEAIPDTGDGGLPSQTGNEGKVLGTDGNTAYWRDMGEDGWNDLTAPLSAGQSGRPDNTPLWADTGNGFWGWHFSSAEDDEAIADFHINHDVKENGKMYPHIHWMPMSYSRGDVVWEFEFITAKGHNQNESLSTSTQKILVKAPGKGLIGEHMVTECNDAQSFTIPEIDSVIRMKIRRLGSHPEDTFFGTVIGLFVDIHYESDGHNSIGRLPDFNTLTGAV